MPVRYGWEYYADSVAGMEDVDRNWDILNPEGPRQPIQIKLV